MKDNKIISYRLMLVTIMLNSCLKFANCTRCIPKQEFAIRSRINKDQCQYTTYLLKSSLRPFYYYCAGNCANCVFHNKRMQTDLIKCSISYVFYKMCSKHRDILG